MPESALIPQRSIGMPLTYTGQYTETETGRCYAAEDSNTGQMVTVDASFEAIQDYGEEAVMDKGSEKYDSGSAVNNVLTVRTSDF